jgi:hypothetical protein
MTDRYIGPAPVENRNIPEYTWEILNINTQSLGNTSDIIVHIDWKKIGTLNGVSASFVGSSDFPLGSIDTGMTYKPIDSVTEADVIQWIRGTIAGAYESVVDDTITNRILEQQSPVVSIEFPWLKTNTESSSNVSEPTSK